MNFYADVLSRFLQPGTPNVDIIQQYFDDGDYPKDKCVLFIVYAIAEHPQKCRWKGNSSDTCLCTDIKQEHFTVPPLKTLRGEYETTAVRARFDAMPAASFLHPPFVCRNASNPYHECTSFCGQHLNAVEEKINEQKFSPSAKDATSQVSEPIVVPSDPGYSPKGEPSFCLACNFFFCAVLLIVLGATGDISGEWVLASVLLFFGLCFASLGIPCPCPGTWKKRSKCARPEKKIESN